MSSEVEQMDDIRRQLSELRKGKVWIDLANKYSWEIGRINPSEGLKYALEAREDATLFRYNKGKVEALRNLAQVYRLLSDFAASLEMCLEALPLCEKDDAVKAQIVNLLGAVYMHEGDHKNAQKYYQECLRINHDLGDKQGELKVLNSIGDLYLKTGEYQKALDQFHECLGFEEIDKMFKGIVLYNVGESLLRLGRNKESLDYLDQAMMIGDELNFPLMTVYCEALKAELFTSEDQYQLAIDSLNVALKSAIEVDSKERQYHIHLQLSGCYKSLGEFDKALQQHEKFHEIKEQVFNESNNKQIKNLQIKQETEALKREADLERKKNQELTGAYQKIEEQNEKIISSINYAKRIQSSILPSPFLLDDLFSEFFVYYAPKDIVSGDFYWATRVGEKVLWAAVDCTGHGVPGALMSMIGANGLNKIVNERKITNPGTVLELLTDHVISQTGADENVKDGMDVSFCCWDKETNILSFAGAHNPLYLLRDKEIQIIKGDRRPIGRYIESVEVKFTTHEIPLKKNDLIYVFTDGYADQFGGETEFKFTYKKFRNLLVEHSETTLTKMKPILSNTLLDWRKDLDQVDDICVIGVRV